MVSVTSASSSFLPTVCFFEAFFLLAFFLVAFLLLCAWHYALTVYQCFKCVGDTAEIERRSR
jgi:hypothetical protein